MKMDQYSTTSMLNLWIGEDRFMLRLMERKELKEEMVLKDRS